VRYGKNGLSNSEIMKYKFMQSRILLLILFLIVNFIGNAEELGVEEDAPPTPSDLPIDGGVSLLIGAGVAYGSMRIKKQNRLRNLS
jgi:hypothetical protein